MKIFPCVLQRDENDCGPACISTIAMSYKKTIPLVKVRELVKTNLNGSNVLGMIKALEFLGFDANAVKCELEQLKDKEITFPIIAHVCIENNFEHYVVIHKYKKGKFIVADPAQGIKIYSLDNLKKIWTGVIILIYNLNSNLLSFKKEKTIFNLVCEVLTQNKSIISKIVIISTLNITIGVFLSFYFKYIIDEIIPTETLDTLTILMIGIIIFSIINIFMELFKNYLLIFFSQKVESSILIQSLNHLIELPISFFNTRKNGEILSRITDIAKIKEIIEEIILIFFIDIPMGMVVGLILFNQNQKLFTISLLMIFLYTFAVILSKDYLKKSNQIVFENTSKLISSLIETTNGIENIKAYNLEELIKQDFKFLYFKSLNNIFKMNVVQFYPNTFNSFVSKIGIFFIIWIGTIEVIDKKITLGELIVFETLLSYFLSPIKNIVNFQLVYQTAKVALDRLNDILETNSEKQINKNYLKLDNLLKKITIKNLNFSYEYSQMCLSNINLSILSGQKIAFVGESGSGKTTIIKLLLKFYNYESGDIFIENCNLKDLDLNFIRDRISYISQNNFLFNKTLKENLLLNSKFSFEEVLEIIYKYKTFRFFNDFPQRFEHLIEENGRNLSTGQKQKISILRGVLKRPDVLIMDEATSNLDSISETEVYQFINDILPNTTQIFISHKLNLIKNCDNIFVLNNGELIESGTHSELLEKHGKYYNLWKEQNYEI